MKTTVKLLATMLLIVISQAAFSHTDPGKGEKNVQVLPAAAGTLKILYVNPSEKVVNVRIYDEKGFLYEDRVKIARGEKGFIKRYEFNRCESSEFWVEIADNNITYKFRMKHYDNGIMWATYWDDFQEIKPALASK